MYFPSAFGPEPFPLPFATYRVRPSGETVTAVGYHPAGISPATRMRCPSRWTTATALFPAIATYNARPSGESASALGSLPSGAWGSRATVRFPTTATRPREGTSASPAANSRALVSASVALSLVQPAPPSQISRYTRLVPPPLAHTVSRHSRPERARPSHAARSGWCHTTRPATGSTRMRPFSPYPLFVTTSDRSESVARLSGSVPTAI